MNNHFPAWTDKNNEMPVNQVIRDLDTSKYQAIIPVPFYHMGSENFNIPMRCNLLPKSCLVSIKTGLPLMAIYSGRASVTHTVSNIAVVLEPYRDYSILNDMPVKKPFLIVSDKCAELSKAEFELIEASSLIDSTSDIMLYRLEFDSLAQLPRKKAEAVREICNRMSIETDRVFKTIPNAEIIYRNLDDSMRITGYRGNSVVINGRSTFSIYKGTINNPGTNRYTVSFWLNPINRDLFPKTRLLVEVSDNPGAVYSYLNVMCGDFIRAFDGTWGLIEFPFEVKDPADRIRIILYNELLKKDQQYYVDELMIKPDSCDLILKNQSSVMMNNRWYSIE